MHIAYVDESGNVGPIKLHGKGGTHTFTLGCVLVPVANWPMIFDNMIQYRRFLKTEFKIPVRAEIKANHLLQNGGAFRDLGLSERARFRVYRGLMRLQPKLGVRAFAVVIEKGKINKATLSPRDVAWEWLLQRLERLTTTENTSVVLMHDEGEGKIVRTLARKDRRIGSAGSAFGTGYLKVPCRNVVDDPVSRQSHESYFLQLADLVAYAAFRRIHPPPTKPVNIVPTGMWDELGAAIYTQANYLGGGVPGIVVWPK